jgi:hypothetical protein
MILKMISLVEKNKCNLKLSKMKICQIFQKKYYESFGAVFCSNNKEKWSYSSNWKGVFEFIFSGSNFLWDQNLGVHEFNYGTKHIQLNRHGRIIQLTNSLLRNNLSLISWRKPKELLFSIEVFCGYLCFTFYIENGVSRRWKIYMCIMKVLQELLALDSFVFVFSLLMWT